jgi:PAS domain S-box-containing protein
MDSENRYCMGDKTENLKQKIGQELGESKEKYLWLFKSSPDMVFIVDRVSGRIIDANETICKLLGYKSEEIIGTLAGSRVVKSQTNSFKKEFAKQKETGNFSGEFELRRKDGDVVPVEVRGSAFGDYLFAFARDITKRKKAEDELRKSEETLSVFMNSAPDAFALFDSELNLVDINKVGLRMLPPGSKKEDVIGKNITEFYSVKEKSRYDKYLEVMKTGKPILIEDVVPGYEFGDVHLAVSAFRMGNGLGLIVSDITERKRSEQEIRRLKNLHEGIIDESPVIIEVVDKDLVVTAWNRYAEDYVNIKKEDIVGKNFFEVIPSLKKLGWDKIFKNVMETGEPYLVKDYKITRTFGPHKGEVWYQDVSVGPLREGEKVTGAIVTINDITERKKAEELLAESKDRFRGLIDSAFDGVTVYIGDKIQDANESFARMFGYTVKEVIGRSASQFTTPESYELIKKNIRQGYEKPYEIVGVKKNGTIFELEVLGKTCKYLGQDARVTALRDISEYKKAQKKVLENEEKFRNLSEQSPNMIFINKRGRVVYANNRCEEIMGYSREEFYAEDFNLLRIIAPESRELVKNNMKRHMKGEEIPPYEYKLLTKDGKEIIGIHTTKLIDYEGERAILGIITDITARKKAEEALKEFSQNLEKRVRERTKELNDARDSLVNMLEDMTKAKTELEEANIKLEKADRLKSVFLASTSHELRTPLNSIIGFTGIMLQGLAGELNKEQDKQLKIVYTNAKHLLNLIEDVLDISRIEAEEIEIYPEEFSIDEVVEEVIEASNPELKKAGLKLEKKVVDGNIYTDKRYFKQSLMNLLDNAIKFTKKGTIKIEAVQHKDSIEVTVKDTGIGIKKKDLYRLFEPFQRIKPTSLGEREGTGLGLYLTKKIVTILGGEITVQSTYRKGSTFTFTLPRRYEVVGNEEDINSRGQ